MGMYVYTLRNKVKTVSGIQIASYQYAYKYSSWGPTRTSAVQEACADRMFGKLSDMGVDVAIHGSWDDITEKDQIPVVKIKHSSYLDDCFINDSNIVGHIVKRGKKYSYIPK